MYRTRIVCLVVAAFLASLWAISAQADTVIYQDTFTRSGDLNGTAPDTALGVFGGTAGATWSANSSVTTDGVRANLDGVAVGIGYLPFAPESGRVYTLSANLTNTNSASGWNDMGMGYSTSSNTTLTQYYGGMYGWAALYGSGAPTSNSIWGLEDPDVTPQAQIGTWANDATTIWAQLDTTGAAWTYSVSVTGGTGSFSAFSGTFAVNPAIVNIGLGSTSGVTGYVDNFTLSVNADVPEPGTLVLFATGLIGLLAYAWRKRK